jgi:hypothetical protein
LFGRVDEFETQRTGNPTPIEIGEAINQNRAVKKLEGTDVVVWQTQESRL